MKSWTIILLGCALALAACSSPTSSTSTPTPTPSPKPTLALSGVLQSVPTGVDLAGATLEATNSNGDVLGTATVKVDGTFNVTLKEPTGSELDLGPHAGDVHSLAATTGYDCDSLDFTPAVRGTAFYEFDLWNSVQNIGVVRWADSFETAATWFENGKSLSQATAYTAIYVQQAVTVTGTNCFRSSNYNVNLEFKLVSGWNTLQIKKSSDSITVTPVATVSGQWFIVAE